MIKDSKLIGTKIAAPFGWKKFKVGELFDVCTTTGFDAGNLVFSNEGTPFIGRTDNNYGFQGFVNGMIGVDSNPANVISISQIGSQSAQYRKEPWYASQNMFYVELLDRNLTLYVGLFFVSIFNKLLQQYSGYTSYPTKNSIFDWIIDLPVTSSGQPDFEWIEQYMTLVQEDYLQQKKLSNQAEIKAYLTESHTDSLEITDADREFLHEFDKLPRRKFKVGKLFEKLSSKYLSTGNKFEHVYKTCTINHNIPMLYAKYDNNGIMYWSKYGEFETHKNCIGIIYNGAVSAGCVFAQEQSTGVLAESYLIKFSTQDVPFKVNLYFSSVLRKILSQKYSREYLATWNKVIDDELELPVLPDSQVDVASIEKYMQIQSKPLINNVAETLTSVGETN